MEDGVLDIPPNEWPKTFGANGVYDITYNMIFMKDGLPQEVYDQVLAHEKAHRAWHHRHKSMTKGILKLWGKPPLFMIFALTINCLSFSIALLDLSSLMSFFAWFAIGLFFAHLLIWFWLLEIPANKVQKVSKSAGSKDLLAQLAVGAIYVTPLILFWISLKFSNVALFVVWLFAIYVFLGALEKSRKAAAKRYNITLKKYSWGNRS